MMFGVLPLIPLAIWGLGVLVGGGAVMVVTHDWETKPPYDMPQKAYQNYVKAVEKNDYNRYQWAVSNPMSEAEFTMRCDQRKNLNLAEITEGAGDVALYKDKTEGVGNALSPWTRNETTIRFKKVADSWKVVDEVKK